MDEEELPQPDDELERTIAALIKRKNAAIPDSAEYRMFLRQLAGLRYSRKDAGGIMEDLDPFGWGEYCTTDLLIGPVSTQPSKPANRA